MKYDDTDWTDLWVTTANAMPIPYGVLPGVPAAFGAIASSDGSVVAFGLTGDGLPPTLREIPTEELGIHHTPRSVAEVVRGICKKLGAEVEQKKNAKE